jgi:hypothetical protein
MIKIYVFVTGLVLYNFGSTSGVPAKAVLAAGNFAYPQLGATIPGHVPEIVTGKGAQAFTVTTPFHWKLGVPCGSDCPITAPQELLQLRRPYQNAQVQSKCLDGTQLADCKVPVVGSRAAAGLLEFSGRWRAIPMTDCPGSYPERFEANDYFTFVSAQQSWKLIPAGNPALPAVIANSVLFTAEINDINDFAISDAALKSRLYSQVHPAADCAKYPGFTTSLATKCVVMAVRVGATGNDDYLAGGDLHYAAIYGMLTQLPAAADLWLPIATQSNSCGGGGGTGGGSHCVGGKGN